jgi:hypothetical protein
MEGVVVLGMSTVQEITEAIEQLDVKQQVQLLHELPRHLKINVEDVAWSRLAEPAFDFWDNPDDAIYDQATRGINRVAER